MKSYRVAVLAGDGVGPEITAQAVAVLAKAGSMFGTNIRFTNALIGGAAIDGAGTPLPAETLTVCRESDAVLLGAVGGPQWDTLVGDKRPEAGLLQIREALRLYANLRPALVYPALRGASPLKAEILADGLDLMVVRELTGGIYFGRRGRTGEDENTSAFDTEQYTLKEIRRILRVAFAMAAKRRGKLCSVDKANVLETSRLWRETATAMAKDYPNVELTHMYVDNAAMQLVRNPCQFDTIVTSNLFGDILSDEASQITGSIGMLPSASLGSGSFGLYEPVHGSAPDIAGKNAANPIAAILSGAMLLRYSLDMPEAAAAIESAVSRGLRDGLRTADLAGPGGKILGTSDMGAAVLARL